MTQGQEDLCREAVHTCRYGNPSGVIPPDSWLQADTSTRGEEDLCREAVHACRHEHPWPQAGTSTRCAVCCSEMPPFTIALTCVVP